MRALQNRYSLPETPVVAKKDRALLAHISPPVKGFAEAAQTAETDAKFAGILINLHPDDDRITVRAGHQKVATMAGGQPVEHLIPYYGEPHRLAAATNNTLCDAETGLLMKAGFTSNAWHWTSHSDLGAIERVVMVNGQDGVWSWDGLNTGDVGPITITKIGKATPPATNAIITVGAGDINKFKNNDAIMISGADAAHKEALGPQRITKVNDTPNTFELIDVVSTNWGGDQTTGTMSAVKQGSFVLEAVKPPAGNTWLDVKGLSSVCAHQNRLFFADDENLAVYYLPIQQRYGELKVLPLNAIFKRGGKIETIATWTVDGGMGMDDQLVIFGTHGEVAIYSGIDPADDFTLVGVFHLDTPMSKWSTLNYGGELYVLLPTGITPMSTVLKSGREGVEASDKNVVSFFLRRAVLFRNNPGWQVYLNPNTGRMMANIPNGGGVYHQMVRAMAKPVWNEFHGIPARCWCWMEPYNYFGDDHGNTYQMHPSIRSDDGKPIYIDVQMAWNQFKTPAIKHFKMVLPYILTDGYPTPSVDLLVDYDTGGPVNVPDITSAPETSSTWDVTGWGDAPDNICNEYWDQGSRSWNNWTGVGTLGRVGAIRVTAQVYNCSFSITGWDVLYDRGSVFG